MLQSTNITWHEGKELENLPAYVENLLVEYYFNSETDSTQTSLAYKEGGYIELQNGYGERIKPRVVKRFALLVFG